MSGSTNLAAWTPSLIGLVTRPSTRPLEPELGLLTAVIVIHLSTASLKFAFYRKMSREKRRYQSEDEGLLSLVD